MYRCITKIVWKSFYAREWWCFFLYLHWRLIQFPFAVNMNLYLAPLFLLLISIILSIQNNPIMALFPVIASRKHNKGQNSTKKTMYFIMLQKHMQWKFFRRWRNKGSKVRSFITHSLEFRILLERRSQNHYFIGLNEDIFGMDYPTGNFLYRSSTGIRKDMIKTVGRKDPVSCTRIIEL